jgi:hypothetical protein
MLYQPFKYLNIVRPLMVIFIFTLLFVTLTSPANAQLVCDWNPASETPPLPTQILCPIVRGVNIIVLMAGVVFTAMVLIASYKYATSLGDPKAAMGASSTLTHAVLGLVLVISTYLILNITFNIFGFSRTVVNPMNPFVQIQQGMCNLLVCSSADPNNPIVKIPGCVCP